MKNKCLDTGVIQAFTDGELGSEASERVLRHVAACEGCAAMLAECEEESAFAFSVLDDELNVLVPTERLRAKVFDRIGEIENGRRPGIFSGFASGLAGLFNFGTPGLSFAAALLAVFAMIAIGFGLLRDQGAGIETAEIAAPAATAPVTESRVSGPAEISTGSPDVAEVAEVSARTDDIPGQRRRPARNAVYSARDVQRTAPAAVPPVESDGPEPSIVSEDSFIQTIATLDRTVAIGKESLSASERFAFERDLAVVDNAIVKMRDEVVRNPQNQAAREVLKASYQNKVDLLNSVAEKSELMASLQ